MAKTNIFGHFDPKTFNTKQVEFNLSFFAFILIRTDLSDWDLLIKIKQQSQHIFKLSPFKFSLSGETDFSKSFPVYIDNKTLKNNFLFFIKNQVSESQIIGRGEKSLFQLKAKTKKIHQLSIPLDEEIDYEFEKHKDEITRWEDFKKQFKQHSLSTLNRIDYILPIHISYYECFLRLFNGLQQIPEITYSLAESSDIEDFKDIIYSFELLKASMHSKIYSSQKELYQ